MEHEDRSKPYTVIYNSVR